MKLRASIPAEIFFDKEDIRAGRAADTDIPECLDAAGFFIAIVSRRYNNSTYCLHKELKRFLDHHQPECGRAIQIRLDRSADLPLPGVMPVEFADARGAFRVGTTEYEDALRRVTDPIVSELDKLYAASKMIFLAWSDDPQLEKEREYLQKEIEGRDLRVYPEAIAAFGEDVRLRKALQDSSASAHLLRMGDDEFENKQLQFAVQVGRPCVVASLNRAETRRGPEGSPTPMFLGQGNPTIAIANEIDRLLGREKRHERGRRSTLGKANLFFVYKPEFDSNLGIRLRQRMRNGGPFEILEPPRGSLAKGRYDQLDRAKAAILCRARADSDWFQREFDAISREIAVRQLYDVRRALYVPHAAEKGRFELGEKDRVLDSDEALDGFLRELQ